MTQDAAIVVLLVEDGDELMVVVVLGVDPAMEVDAVEVLWLVEETKGQMTETFKLIDVNG